MTSCLEDHFIWPWSIIINHMEANAQPAPESWARRPWASPSSAGRGVDMAAPPTAKAGFDGAPAWAWALEGRREARDTPYMDITTRKAGGRLMRMSRSWDDSISHDRLIRILGIGMADRRGLRLAQAPAECRRHRGRRLERRGTRCRSGLERPTAIRQCGIALRFGLSGGSLRQEGPRRGSFRQVRRRHRRRLSIKARHGRVS
jgi:hypothetical protein